LIVTPAKAQSVTASRDTSKSIEKTDRRVPAPTGYEYSSILATGPLILTLAKMPAAMACEC